MTPLRAVGRYRNDVRGLVFVKGDTFEADHDLLRFLMSDAPECFEEVTAKAVSAPPADKAMRAPDKAK